MIVLRLLTTETIDGRTFARCGVTVNGHPFHSEGDLLDNVLDNTPATLRAALAHQESLPVLAPTVTSLRDAIEGIREAAIQEGANDIVAAAIAHACLVARLTEDEPS